MSTSTYSTAPSMMRDDILQEQLLQHSTSSSADTLTSVQRRKPSAISVNVGRGRSIYPQQPISPTGEIMMPCSEYFNDASYLAEIATSSEVSDTQVNIMHVYGVPRNRLAMPDQSAFPVAVRSLRCHPFFRVKAPRRVLSPTVLPTKALYRLCTSRGSDQRWRYGRGGKGVDSA